MRVGPYLLGPGLRQYAAALLYDPPLIVDVPAMNDDAGEVFVSIVDAAKQRDSSVASALGVGEQYLWLQTRLAKSEFEALSPLRDHVRLERSLYSGTREVFDQVRELFLANRNDVLALTNTVPGLAAAAFDFHWRVYECSLELGGDVDAVIASLEAAAVGLTHPHELVAESLVNRFLCTFGSFVTKSGTTGHVAVDSEAALRLGAACMQRRSTRPNPSDDADPANIPPDMFVEPVAYELFANITHDDVPVLSGGRHAERLAVLLERQTDALDALREKCRTLARELFLSRSAGASELPTRLQTILERLHDEASAVKRIDRTATKKVFQQLCEDPTIWTLIPGVLLGGIATPELTSAGAIALLGRVGALAMKARRERNESLAGNDLRFLYYASRKS